MRRDPVRLLMAMSTHLPDWTPTNLGRGRCEKCGEPTKDMGIFMCLKCIRECYSEILIQSSEDRRLEFIREVFSDGGFTVKRVSNLLNVTPGVVDYMISCGDLLILERKSGYELPCWQFDGSSVVSDLSEVLAAIPVQTALEKAIWMSSPSIYLGGRRPIDLLREGQLNQVLAEAKLVGLGM